MTVQTTIQTKSDVLNDLHRIGWRGPVSFGRPKLDVILGQLRSLTDNTKDTLVTILRDEFAYTGPVSMSKPELQRIVVDQFRRRHYPRGGNR